MIKFGFILFVIFGFLACNRPEDKLTNCLDSSVYSALTNFDKKLNESKLVDSLDLETYVLLYQEKTNFNETFELSGLEKNNLSTPSVFAIMAGCISRLNSEESKAAKRYLLLVEKNDVSRDNLNAVFKVLENDKLSKRDKRLIAVHLIWVKICKGLFCL